jgi:ligand-binding sensor domain-containing protein
MELFGNNWFFGTSSNGAFYSPNNGVTWTQATNGISPNASVSCFVRFGTGVYTATKDGVHKSNDGGVSWTLLNTGLPIDTGVIKKGVHALGSRNLLLFAGTDNYGIYQSNDEGVTWVKSAGALTNVFVNTFISTSYYLYAATSQGVFYYDEQANDWKKTITDPTTIYVNSIAVTDKNLFAATTNGVFKSTDNGGVWVSASTGIPKDSYMHCIKTIKERVLTGMYNDLFLFDANNNKWISIHKELPFCPVTDIYTANTYLFACTGGKGVWYATTDAVIGISEYAKPAAFKVYPNPGSGIFKIAESGNSQLYSISRVEVVNATGACVYQLANPDLSSEIDLSKEARGVYVLRIISKEGAFENHKIVVE